MAIFNLIQSNTHGIGVEEKAYYTSIKWALNLDE